MKSDQYYICTKLTEGTHCQEITESEAKKTASVRGCRLTYVTIHDIRMHLFYMPPMTAYEAKGAYSQMLWDELPTFSKIEVMARYGSPTTPENHGLVQHRLME